MIRFTPITVEDQPQILEWMLADPYHKHQADYSGPGWWLTGQKGSQLAFCLQDDTGPVLFARVDEGDPAKLHTQFAPAEIVPKSRLVRAMLKAMPVLFGYLRSVASAVVFESTSLALIQFFEKQNFKSVGNDLYELTFEEPVLVDCGTFDGVK